DRLGVGGQVVDLPAGDEGAGDLLAGGAGLVAGAVGEGDPAAVDHRVHHGVHDDLPAQRVRLDLLGEPVAQHSGEVAHQRGMEPLAVGDVGAGQVVLERQLG